MHSNPHIESLLAALNNPSLPGIDLSLERMRALLAALGNPQERMPPAIHVAGTNGKGSTMAFLRSIYRGAGYRVHAYHSPHLVRFNERILLDGAQIDDALLESCLERVTDAARGIAVTFFEATTAAAFLAFAERPADLLLLEVGLGGRLDATNLVEKVLASVITPIGLDHREFLGNTLSEIAREKAGILRVGIPSVTAPQVPEVMAVLKQVAPEIVEAASYDGAIGLTGVHQRINTGVAATVVKLLNPRLPVGAELLARGMAAAEWPARLQLLTHGPLVDVWHPHGEVRLDGGHNAHAAAALAEWVRAQEGKMVMVAGLMARKDPFEFLSPFHGLLDGMVFIPIPGNDSHPPEILAQIAGELGMKAQASSSLEEALAALQPVGKATLLVAGSLYLAGEVLKNNG